MPPLFYLIYIVLLLFFAGSLSIHFNIALFITNKFFTNNLNHKQAIFYLGTITLISLIKPGVAGVDGIIITLFVLTLYFTYKLIPTYKRGLLFWLIIFLTGTIANYFIYFSLLTISSHDLIRKTPTNTNKALFYIGSSLFLYLLQFIYAKPRDY